MRPELTLPEIIAALPSLEELEGAEEQIKRDGRLTGDVLIAITNRRAELTRGKR